MFEITNLIVDSTVIYESLRRLGQREELVAQAQGRLVVDFFHGKLVSDERIVDNRYLGGGAFFPLTLDVYASQKTIQQPRLEQVSTFTPANGKTFRALSQQTYSGRLYWTLLGKKLGDIYSVSEYAQFCLAVNAFLQQPKPRVTIRGSLSKLELVVDQAA